MPNSITVRVTPALSYIDAYSIEGVQPPSAGPPPSTLCQTICITWNSNSTYTTGPLPDGPSTLPALSTACFKRVPDRTHNGHLVVSKSLFDALVAALATRAVSFNLVHGSTSFTIVCHSSIEEGDPLLATIAATVQATDAKVQTIEGHLVEMKSLLQTLVDQNAHPLVKSNGTEFVSASGSSQGQAS